MYSHQNKDRFATAIVLISTVPFAIIAVLLAIF